MENVPAELRENPEISKALDELEESSYSQAELAAYDKFWDIVSTEKTLIKGKTQEAMEKGYAKGMEKGIKEGEARGITKGFLQGKIATAKNFLAMKLTPEQVAAGTGLSLEEVLALMKEQ